MINSLKCKYEGNTIAFELHPNGLTLNATEMAKIFDKRVNNFTRNKGTREFIRACINAPNTEFIEINSESDLVHSVQKSGTWMHWLLALKFAAWLDVDFELWVYSRIEEIKYMDYTDPSLINMMDIHGTERGHG